MIIKFKKINYNIQDKFIFALADAGYKTWIEKTYQAWPRESQIENVYVCVEINE